MVRGGTEAFPELGAHCQFSDCNQLDFLPFRCDGCSKVFCLEHRSSKSHACLNPDYNNRKVLACETCSMSIEIIAGETEKMIQEKHKVSGVCDPKRKKKPICAARRCREILTFSNNTTCRTCHLKFCLRHRFQADHACKGCVSTSSSAAQVSKDATKKISVVSATRDTNNSCLKKECGPMSPPSNPSVKAH